MKEAAVALTRRLMSSCHFVVVGAQTLRRSLVAVFAVAVVGLGHAAAASAATVTFDDHNYYPIVVRYVAAAGERNDVSLAYDPRGRTRFSDPGAVITARRPCTSIDAHTAMCPVDDRVRLALGDLDDRVTPAKHYSDELLINGGPGNDILHGSDNYGEAYDRLNGGGGQDQLYGGGGNDTLTDGDRDGAAGEAAPGPDILDGGGGGQDTLTYETRTKGVRVRAGVSANAGEPGERDRVAGIEQLVAGAGDDRLLGGQGYNKLHGGAGRDTLKGRGTADNLYGGSGADRVFGGGGSDVLFPGAGTDVIGCGAGNDRTYHVQAREVLPRSCDEVSFTWDGGREWDVRAYPTGTRTGSLRLSTGCPLVYFGDSEDGISCHGTVTVREVRGQHRLLARGFFSHGPIDGLDFEVPLARTATGYRWSTGQLGHATATTSVRISAVHTPTRPFKWTIRTLRHG